LGKKLVIIEVARGNYGALIEGVVFVIVASFIVERPLDLWRC
jgi:hypothetical protein